MAVYYNQVKVTNQWFVPHFPARVDHPLEMALLKLWKEHMSYEDYYGGTWSSRIALLLSSIPRGCTTRSARVATTFALWCFTPVGRGFLDPLVKAVQPYSFMNDQKAVCAWAHENRLDSSSRNRLVALMHDEQGQPAYSRRPYPTLEDSRAAEVTTCFFASEEGMTFLRKVCKEAGMPHYLPL